MTSNSTSVMKDRAIKIFDEPTSGLGRDNTERISKILQDLKQRVHTLKSVSLISLKTFSLIKSFIYGR
jgi:energy-coupling factor transporter ATP-binding protein EcfA2